MNLSKNMGTLDRGLRGAVGVILAVLVYLGFITGTWAVVAGVVSVLLVLTSVVGFCPPYALFGWNTCGCTTAKPPAFQGGAGGDGDSGGGGGDGD
jgi:hypothetical protein